MNEQLCNFVITDLKNRNTRVHTLSTVGKSFFGACHKITCQGDHDTK